MLSYTPVWFVRHQNVVPGADQLAADPLPVGRHKGLTYHHRRLKLNPRVYHLHCAAVVTLELLEYGRHGLPNHHLRGCRNRQKENV